MTWPAADRQSRPGGGQALGRFAVLF